MAKGYGKIYRRIWQDENVQQLSPLDKLLVCYLLTGQSNRIGLFCFSPSLASEDLGIPMKGTRMGMARVCDALRWHFDEQSRVVWIPTWWRHNADGSWKTLKGRLADLDDVPRCELKARFLTNYDGLNEGEARVLDAHTQGHAIPIPKGMPSQEQEHEHEHKHEQEHENNKRARTRAKIFAKPTVEQVREYCQQRQNDIDAEAFVDFYETRGWKLKGGVAMKDWRAAVRTWERNGPARHPQQANDPRGNLQALENYKRGLANE